MTVWVTLLFIFNPNFILDIMISNTCFHSHHFKISSTNQVLSYIDEAWGESAKTASQNINPSLLLHYLYHRQTLYLFNTLIPYFEYLDL